MGQPLLAGLSPNQPYSAGDRGGRKLKGGRGGGGDKGHVGYCIQQ